MARGSKARLEVFAQALAAGHSPVEAARAAKYPNGSSFAANARKRAQRKDVKARVAELTKPALDKVAAAIEANVAWASRHLVDVAEKAFKEGDAKIPDGIRAIDLLAKLHGWLAPEKHEHTGKDGAPLLDVSKLSDDQLAVLEGILSTAAVVDGAGGNSASKH